MPLSAEPIATPHQEQKWDQYVRAHPSSCGYHLIGWRQVIADAFGHKSFYLMATEEDGTVKGILPLVLLSSRLFGRFMVSLPFFSYGGVLADDAEARDVLLDAAVRAAMENKADHIELRQQGLCGLQWPRKEHKVSMRLELPGEFADLWKSFTSKLRSQVRRAQKEQMRVGMGGVAMLDDFYQVFSRAMRDLGTPVYGKGFFQAILRRFPADCRLCVVWWRGKPLAAGLLYGFKDTLEIPWASADKRYSRLAANMLLYSSVLEHACGQRYKVFDFGRSTVGSGTFRFKQQWGAQPIPLYWYYWLQRGEPLPELNHQNPRYALAVNAWQKLPVRLTQILGPRIVKSLP